MAKNETYEQFTAKFKPKLTTDDCYTPPHVYDCVRDYVDAHVAPLAGRRVVRPFWPGADYERFDYRPGDIVLDNPPFSRLARILDFYLRRGIRFWLFAPGLTLFNYATRPRVTCVAASCNITYKNGAEVCTSFITDLYPRSPAFVVDGRLHEAVEEAQERLRGGKHMPVLKYPPSVVSAAMLSKVAERGICWECPRSEARFVRRLDCGKEIYGGGFILSERMAAERMAAERMAERETQVFGLSARELAIQASLH